MWTMTARQALCTTVPYRVCARSTHSHTHTATQATHTTIAHTHTQCVTHTQPWPRRPRPKVWRTSACRRTLGILLVPHTYASRCAAVPPTYAHRQATQRSRPAPSHGATAARHRTSRASRCRRPAALYPLARASTHDAHERSSALYSGNGPPEAPTPGSRAAVLSPTSNDGATHDSVHCTHHRAPRVGTLHAEIPTPPCHVSIPAASPLHRACGFGCQ